MSYDLILRVPRTTTAEELARIRNQVQDRVGRYEVLSLDGIVDDALRDACSIGAPGRTTPEEMASLFALLKDLARQGGWHLYDPQAGRYVELESKEPYPQRW